MAQEILPEGKYEARAVEWEFGAAGTGTEYIAIRFEIVSPASKEGRRVKWRGFLTEAAAEFTFKVMQYCGWDGRSLQGESLERLGDNVVQITVKHESSEDGQKTWAAVQWVNPCTPLVKDALRQDQIGSLEQRLKGRMLQVQQEVGDRPRPKPAQQQSSECDSSRGSEDDFPRSYGAGSIPF